MFLKFNILVLLSFCILFYDLPISYGNPTGYTQKTLAEVLTPAEQAAYVNYNVLPSRISTLQNGNLIENGNGKTELSRPGYTTIPRWKYMLEQLLPGNNLLSAYDHLQSGSKLMFSLLGDGGNNSQSKESSLINTVLTSDITKMAAKAAILFFGGPGALAAFETGSQIANVKEITKNLPRFN